METDEQLLERFHTLTDRERQDLGVRIESRFQAKINAMKPAEKLILAEALQDILVKYQG